MQDLESLEREALARIGAAGGTSRVSMRSPRSSMVRRTMWSPAAWASIRCAIPSAGTAVPSSRHDAVSRAT